MPNMNDFPEERKMRVLFRIEPGSLGPDGAEHVVEFCLFAQAQFQACSVYYLNWVIEPRFDKKLKEMNFELGSKELDKAQVDKYFAFFGENYAHFVEQLENNLEAMIDQYFGR